MVKSESAMIDGTLARIETDSGEEAWHTNYITVHTGERSVRPSTDGILRALFDTHYARAKIDRYRVAIEGNLPFGVRIGRTGSVSVVFRNSHGVTSKEVVQYKAEGAKVTKLQIADLAVGRRCLLFRWAYGSTSNFDADLRDAVVLEVMNTMSENAKAAYDKVLNKLSVAVSSSKRSENRTKYARSRDIPHLQKWMRACVQDIPDLTEEEVLKMYRDEQMKLILR